jgi:AcrR family transcriptional regulator
VDERAERILDAAVELLLRYGYAKTTIEDVARAAGVAKGTVYLRWRTREQLFHAVLRRERTALLDDVRDAVAAVEGPVGTRLLIAEMVRAYQRRPLLAAVLMRDTAVLGALAEAAEGAPAGGIVEHLAQLRADGLIDTDRSLAEQVTVLSSVFLGYFMTQPLMPSEFRVPDDTVPELLADTVHRALQRAEPLTDVEVAALDTATRAYVEAAAKEAHA